MEHLDGVITAEQYGQPQGRIAFVDEYRWKEVERQEPTADKDGYILYVDEITGEKRTEVLPKVPGKNPEKPVKPEVPKDDKKPSKPQAPKKQSKNAKTGDVAMMAGELFLLSAGAWVVVTALKRREIKK